MWAYTTKTFITQCVTRALLSNVCNVLIKQVTFLKRSHTTAYDISVCERIALYVKHKWGTFSNTLTNVRVPCVILRYQLFGGNI